MTDDEYRLWKQGLRRHEEESIGASCFGAIVGLLGCVAVAFIFVNIADRLKALEARPTIEAKP